MPLAIQAFSLAGFTQRRNGEKTQRFQLPVEKTFAFFVLLEGNKNGHAGDVSIFKIKIDCEKSRPINLSFPNRGHGYLSAGSISGFTSMVSLIIKTPFGKMVFISFW